MWPQVRDDFINVTPKSQSIKEKMINFTQNLKSLLFKIPLRIKRQPNTGRKLINPISDKVFVSKIYKELIKRNNKKITIKNWQKI